MAIPRAEGDAYRKRFTIAAHSARSASESAGSGRSSGSSPASSVRGSIHRGPINIGPISISPSPICSNAASSADLIRRHLIGIPCVTWKKAIGLPG
ncbi:hypothetical protein [Spirillospora sp. NPDC029432]|uniref:hypothetical protein n=1 Tax=Spirillospora sp. NPDC029432 TaxID=3154599 RepID=UPI003453EBB5